MYAQSGDETGTPGVKTDENIRRKTQWNSESKAGLSIEGPWRMPESGKITTERNEPPSLPNHYHNLIRLRNIHPVRQVGEPHLANSQKTAVFAQPGQSAARLFNPRPAY
ncbi:MAG: hypothetical protein JXA13_06155 [Anaerolineales bacterium]|nr:hypothetical protein [Anaerolineales bacterium]